MLRFSIVTCICCTSQRPSSSKGCTPDHYSSHLIGFSKQLLATSRLFGADKSCVTSKLMCRVRRPWSLVPNANTEQKSTWASQQVECLPFMAAGAFYLAVPTQKNLLIVFCISSLVVTRTSVKKETVYSHVTVSWPPSLLSRLQIPRTSNYLQTPQKRPRGPSKYDYIARLIFWTIQLRLFNTMEKYIYSLRPSLKEIPIKKQDQDVPPKQCLHSFSRPFSNKPHSKASGGIWLAQILTTMPPPHHHISPRNPRRPATSHLPKAHHHTVHANIPTSFNVQFLLTRYQLLTT